MIYLKVLLGILVSVPLCVILPYLAVQQPLWFLAVMIVFGVLFTLSFRDRKRA
jgi:glycopeptide antibiotics resistance protein